MSEAVPTGSVLMSVATKGFPAIQSGLNIYQVDYCKPKASTMKRPQRRLTCENAEATLTADMIPSDRQQSGRSSRLAHR